MVINAVSNAGTYEVYNAAAPNWGRLSDGYAYSVCILNATPDPITSGTYTFQGAASRADDPCSPDDATWADLVDYPACDALPGTVEGPARIAFTTASPLPGHTQCQYAIACPEPFIRVNGPATPGVSIIAVVTRLRRSGGV